MRAAAVVDRSLIVARIGGKAVQKELERSWVQKSSSGELAFALRADE